MAKQTTVVVVGSLKVKEIASVRCTTFFVLIWQVPCRDALYDFVEHSYR